MTNTAEVHPEIAAIGPLIPAFIFTREGLSELRAQQDAGFAAMAKPLSDDVERVDHLVSSDPRVVVRVHRPKNLVAPAAFHSASVVVAVVKAVVCLGQALVVLDHQRGAEVVVAPSDVIELGAGLPAERKWKCFKAIILHVSQTILDRTPMQRWGRPEEITGPVLFLCSPSAAFVTGVILPVDGGYSIA